MSKTSIIDRYIQRIAQNSQISVNAGDLSVSATEKWATGWNPKDKLAVLIQRIRYTFGKEIVNLDAAADEITFGIQVTGNTQPAGGWTPSASGVIDWNYVGVQYGTLVGGMQLDKSIVKDFFGFGGGGLLAHPASITSFWANTCTAAIAAIIPYTCEIYYQFVELSDSDWQEMWQLGYISSQF